MVLIKSADGKYYGSCRPYLFDSDFQCNQQDRYTCMMLPYPDRWHHSYMVNSYIHQYLHQTEHIITLDHQPYNSSKYLPPQY